MSLLIHEKIHVEAGMFLEKEKVKAWRSLEKNPRKCILRGIKSFKNPEGSWGKIASNFMLRPQGLSKIYVKLPEGPWKNITWKSSLTELKIP